MPVTKDLSSTSNILVSSELGFHTTSYFLDSSGRTKFVIPLQIGCRNKEDLDMLVASGCLQPPPSGVDVEINSEPSSVLRFEVKSLSQLDSKVVTVEGISITSCSVQGTFITLETEIVVRSSAAPMNETPSAQRMLSQRFSRTVDEENFNKTDYAKVEVTAVLVTKGSVPSKEGSDKLIRGLEALNVGSGSWSLRDSRLRNQVRLKPISVFLSITQALSVTTTSVRGSTSGSTLVSLSLEHSNTHSEPVTITNIALHPGHSRLEPSESTDRSMPGGHESVTDMSKYVKWGYAPQTEPKLPMVLQPYDAFATVILIEAGEDLRSRTFFSPVSITAIVGSQGDTEGEPTVVVGADAQWETGRIAVEPTDAFRIDMSLEHSSCVVGAPLVVSLRVLNLGTETRDLMLLMAKDEESSDSAQKVKVSSVNTAVVAESGGYVFGVWGLSGDDDGTTRHNRDHELLAVDAALLIGEVKGQHSVDAELRFVPLREGTLDVPNLKLYDKIEGKWYNCNHMLKIVAAAKKDSVTQ